jgi:hypothetical protein
MVTMIADYFFYDGLFQGSRFSVQGQGSGFSISDFGMRISDLKSPVAGYWSGTAQSA